MPDVGPEVLRIIDANLNRAREALRVIEDGARFAFDDRDAAAAAKRARHDLRRIADALGPDALLAARDIRSDVGRDARTDAELQRGSIDEVLRAAFARLAEAARAIAEYVKTAPALAPVVPVAENARYAAYELEQRLVLRGHLRRAFRERPLYVIITARRCRTDWLDTAEAAIRGGAGTVQLREKDLPDAELLARARTLRDLTRRLGALFIINDRADIARLADADGVHLGQDDLPVREARRIAGHRLLVGKSTHSLEQFRAALEEAPDYLAFGPLFPSPTKPEAPVVGPAALAEAARLTDLPLVGIGGLDAHNAARAFDAGATIACVSSAVIAAADPRAAAEAILRAAPRSPPSPAAPAGPHVPPRDDPPLQNAAPGA